MYCERRANFLKHTKQGECGVAQRLGEAEVYKYGLRRHLALHVPQLSIHEANYPAPLL